MKEFIRDNLRAFVVPVDILDRDDLDVYEKMVYVVLRSYANPNSLTAFPSYSTIAQKASISKAKAIRTVKSLVEKGILLKKERFTVTEAKNIIRGSNEYQFADLRGSVHGTPGWCTSYTGVVSDIHQGGVHGTPYIYIDKDQDKDNDIDIDQIDQDLRNHIEKLGIEKQARDIVKVYEKGIVTKKLFLEVLERVSEKIEGVKNVEKYLIRSLKNEVEARKKNKGLPESLTSPKKEVEISEAEARKKVEKAEWLLRQLGDLPDR